MYGKHFASAYTGSMVGAGLNVFAVWGYVIAHTVKGRVEINPVLLAMILGCKTEEVDAAIEYLMRPDPHSRSPVEGGRRLIREGEYQFSVPTHEAYRRILNEDERREYNRIKQAESRARKAAVKEPVNDSQACQHIQKQSTETETGTAGVGDEVSRDLQQLAFTTYRRVPQELAQWQVMYPVPWIPLAIQATLDAGKTNPAYTKAILERWRKEGGPDAQTTKTPDDDGFPI